MINAPLLLIIAVAIHLCQSVRNETHERKTGSHEQKQQPYFPITPFRKHFFAGNATVSVLNAISGSYACYQIQSYTKGNYSSSEQGEYYHIYSTGEKFHRSQVLFHNDFATNATISVCGTMISVFCYQISLRNTQITSRVCLSMYDFEVIYLKFCETASTVKQQTDPEQFLILRLRKYDDLIENRNTPETMKSETKCQAEEFYDKKLGECDKPYFIAGEKTFPVRNASYQLACFKKRTYSQGNYTLIEKGEYYYINSTGEIFPRKQVFSEVDTFSSGSISICENSISMICVKLNFYDRLILVCQSVKNNSDALSVMQFADVVWGLHESIDESVTSFLAIIAMPGVKEWKREECRPGGLYNEKLHICHDLSSKKYYFFVDNETLPVFNTTFRAGNKTVPEVNTTLSRRNACVRKKTYSRDDYTSIENGKYYLINSTGESIPRKRVFFEGDGARNKTISVCEQMAFLTCAEVKSENLTTYNLSEYGIQNETIFMCSHENPPKQIKWSTSMSVVIQEYLSLVCLVLSLTCLFLVIQTYLIFPELRNLPGKNLLSLSISLFLAQLMWVIPDQRYSTTLCHVAAVIKHHLFLASFVAMATTAWNTYVGFTTQEFPVQKTEMKKREKRKFYQYLAIVWGLPAIFVVTCAVVDETDIYAVYVNDLLCWFDNPQPHKYLFILPIGLLQLFNIILFSLTVFRIQRIRSSTKSVRSDQQRKTMFWIYLKLSSLMGFSWLFGFIHLLVGSSTVVFTYLFVIFSTLQGVYIALAFVIKKRIWKMYAKLLGRNPKFKPGYSTNFSENLMKSEETRL